VRSRQGGGSMSDDDKGHPRLFELKDRLGESRLSGLVEIGVWFIENDESRAAKYHTREPDALTLTTREPNATVADPSVEALRQILTQLVRTGERCRFPHRFSVDGLHPRDVVAHRAGEQLDVLRQKADVPPELRRIPMVDRRSIKPDLADIRDRKPDHQAA